MTSFSPVQPGDLITAATWNQIVAELNSLDARVAALEASEPSTGGAPVINATIPAPPITVPSRLTILGANFVTPPTGQNTITVDGASINEFVQGSTNTQLIFDLPSFSGLPETVELTVTNRNGTSQPFPLAAVAPPPAIPQGTTDFTKVTQNLGVINVGSKYTFQFQLGGTLTEAEQFNLSAAYLNAQGAAATEWQTTTVLVDGEDNPISNSQITLSQGNSSKTVGVSVVVPSGATSVQLVVHATSVHNDQGLSVSSSLIQITIGQAYQDNPNAPTFLFEAPPVGAPIREQEINNVEVIQVSIGQTVHITFQAALKIAGDYTFTAALDDPAGLWSLPSPASSIVDPPSFTAGSATTQTVTVSLTSLATSVSSTLTNLTLTTTVTQPGSNTIDFSSDQIFPIGVFALSTSSPPA